VIVARFLVRADSLVAVLQHKVVYGHKVFRVTALERAETH